MSTHEITESDVAKLQSILEQHRQGSPHSITPEMCGAVRLTLGITDANCKFLADLLEIDEGTARRHAYGECSHKDIPPVEAVKKGAQQYRFSRNL